MTPTLAWNPRGCCAMKNPKTQNVKSSETAFRRARGQGSFRGVDEVHISKKVLSNMSWGPSGQVRPGKFMALRPRNLGSIPSYRWILASSQWDSETSEGIKDAPFSGTSKPSQWQWGLSSLRLHLRTCSLFLGCCDIWLRYQKWLMFRLKMVYTSQKCHFHRKNFDDQQVDFFGDSIFRQTHSRLHMIMLTALEHQRNSLPDCRLNFVRLWLPLIPSLQVLEIPANLLPW